ncbi:MULTISPECIES: BrnT family toxin [unclassified Achromobacter]|uniref:BrnT family toxin n=1 Tax=unclassified Achromobacter TaxID=2626865 RepID=UPI000B51889C|nr:MULTISPECIES: BrnT family toxin [unclassified Achromobacter]OWT75359.1 hypothetical protein CEY04_17315 [Achromobacter sp. HZ28]OWT76019.1 hypothetical protein CEY05_12765 [Achromobacter sp. HZ34]
MAITYDFAKSVKNVDQRGLSFGLVHRFDWDSALILVDNRREYNEARYQALGTIENRLHMLVFTMRGDDIRVISLRKANGREKARYEEARPRID